MLTQKALYGMSYLLSPCTVRAVWGKWLCPIHTCILGIEYNAWHAGGRTLLREWKAHSGLSDIDLRSLSVSVLSQWRLELIFYLPPYFLLPAALVCCVSSVLWWPFSDPQRCKPKFEHTSVPFYSYDEEAPRRLEAFMLTLPPHLKVTSSEKATNTKDTLNMLAVNATSGPSTLNRSLPQGITSGSIICPRWTSSHDTEMLIVIAWNRKEKNWLILPCLDLERHYDLVVMQWNFIQK